MSQFLTGDNVSFLIAKLTPLLQFLNTKIQNICSWCMSTLCADMISQTVATQT